MFVTTMAGALATSVSRGIKCVLIDCSGTLHIDNDITKNAAHALEALRDYNFTLRFVTNTTKESKRLLRTRLLKLGFKIKENEIFSSLTAACDLIKQESLKPLLLVDDQAMEDFKEVSEFEGPPNAVVIGLAPDKFNRQTLNLAFRLLLNGAKLIAIHEGRFYRSRSGLSLGPGPFVKILEYATNVKATVVGKPNPEFFKKAILDHSPTETIMIGDDVRDDIKGAQELGIRGFLVRTGKYREGDEHLIENPPYAVMDNFAMAVDKIIAEVTCSKK